jgi:hypothetical protein
VTYFWAWCVCSTLQWPSIQTRVQRSPCRLRLYAPFRVVLFCQSMGKGQAARQEESLSSTSQVSAAQASVKLYFYPHCTISIHFCSSAGPLHAALLCDEPNCDAFNPNLSPPPGATPSGSCRSSSAAVSGVIAPLKLSSNLRQSSETLSNWVPTTLE